MKVRIKEWDKMSKMEAVKVGPFGELMHDSQDFIFVPEMMGLCGKTIEVYQQGVDNFREYDSEGAETRGVNWGFSPWMFDVEINGEYHQALVPVKAVQTAYEVCLTALKLAKKNRPKKTYEYINVISKEREWNVAKIRAEYNTDLKLQEWITQAATRRALCTED